MRKDPKMNINEMTSINCKYLDVYFNFARLKRRIVDNENIKLLNIVNQTYFCIFSNEKECTTYFYPCKKPFFFSKNDFPTCLCKFATVAGSCSKIKLLAPTLLNVSKY